MNLVSQEAAARRQMKHVFKDSLSYRVRPWLNKSKVWRYRIGEWSPNTYKAPGLIPSTVINTRIFPCSVGAWTSHSLYHF